jgi:dolichol-phosphate mannosyltransferase
MSFIALLSSIYILFKAYYSGYEVTGWASLMISILFTSGSILTMIGVIGIYVGRVYTEAKNRPLFIVSERMN